jgi:hypothetical protein
MTEQRAQKLWEIYCDELIDNGDKNSEDVRQALATVIRWIAEPLYGDGVFMTDVEAEKFQIADTLNELADELEELEND